MKSNRGGRGRRLCPSLCLWAIVLILVLPVLCGVAYGQQQTPSGLPGQTGTTAPRPSPDLPGTPTATTGGSEQFLFLEVRAFSNLTRITGEARERSFLTGGNNNGVDFSFLENFTLGARRVEAVSILRYTDDRRVDPERNSLQRAYLRVNGPRSEINFGDYLVSYSRLTYNQNLKGFHFIKSANWGRGFRLLGNAGTFTDRYGSLFKDELPGKPFTRVVSGVRAEQRLDVDKTLGFNWAYGNDIVRSIPIDPVLGREPFVPVSNHVASLDARMLFGGVWNLDGEFAYSTTNVDTRFNPDNRKDYGLRFDNSLRAAPWSLSVFFTRIMPSFTAINARQVADLQDVLARVGVDVSRQVLLQASYRRTHDDLREQNPNPRTVFQLPEVRASFRDLPGLGATILDVGYRERRQEQTGIADRITRTPFFEAGIPISSSVLTFGFEHRASIDRQNPVNQSSTNDASVSFRSIFNLGNWEVTPLFRYQHNREIFDRVDSGNNNRTIQAALVLDAPKYVTFEGMFRQVGATLFQDAPVIDPATLRPVIGPKGLPEFVVTGPSGFRRPAVRVALAFRLFNDANRLVTFSYERNNNRFAVPGQNFLERVMQVSVIWRFRSQ